MERIAHGVLGADFTTRNRKLITSKWMLMINTTEDRTRQVLMPTITTDHNQTDTTKEEQTTVTREINVIEAMTRTMTNNTNPNNNNYLSNKRSNKIISQ